MIEQAFVSCGMISGTARCISTRQSLAHLLDVGERGIAVEATLNNSAVAEKQCSGPCGQVKPLTEFYRADHARDGWRSRCRDCMRAADQRRYAANPEAAKAAKREVSRRYRQAHPDEARRIVDEYQARNRGAVLDHYGRSCVCCGTTEDLAIDHVNGDGGAHRKEVGAWAMNRWLITHGFPDGFQTLCIRCNSSKANGPRCRIDHDLDGVTPEVPGVRFCLVCERIIDPIHYCPDCAASDRSCDVHPKPHRRADVLVCSQRCQMVRTPSSPPARIVCGSCGLRVRLRKDGTIGTHRTGKDKKAPLCVACPAPEDSDGD